MTAKAAVLGREKPETAYFSFPIIRKEYTPEGDLMVYGPCTDGSRDSDHQKVDPSWSAKALDTWIKTGGNVRVQHSPFLYPAGKGKALETFKDGTDSHWLKALVLRSTPAFDLVEKTVLRDFSIGVLDPVTVFNDPSAPAGTICGGEIGEVSLVDRGSNKNTSFTICKAARDGSAELVLRLYGKLANQAMFGSAVNKRQLKDGRVVDSGGQDRSSTPDADFAGPNKTFPVDSRDDVSDAASLAHHADDPDGVRSKIRAIARRKFGMSDEDMPESLKAEDCGTCHGKGTIMQGNRKCPDCSGPVEKGDAAQDYPGDRDTDAEEPSDEAEEESVDDGKDDDKPEDEAQKAIDAKKLRKKLIKAQREALLKGAFPEGDNGSKTPEAATGHADPDAAERGFESAADKKMRPAGKHREPDGAVVEDLEHDAHMHSDKGSDDIGFGIRRLHDLTCPAYAFKSVRKAYGLRAEEAFEDLPERELQTRAMKAIGDSDWDLAAHYTAILDTIGGIRTIGPDMLLDARKALPGLTPGVAVHPSQRNEVRPSQFRGGYLSAGHPALNAGGEASHGAKLPAAPVHHVSAQDFHRGFIGSGHSSMSPSGGHQASASTAAFGQALNSLASLHTRVRALAPDMCPLNVTEMDLSHSQEGHTGIRPSTMAPAPERTIGERGGRAMKAAGALAGADAVADEQRLRKKLAKAQLLNQELTAENERLGSLPSLDPEDAPYRGTPELSGPVDRRSLVGKSVGDGVDDVMADDQEYIDYLTRMTGSGDPRMRASAMKVLTAMVTK